MNKLIGGAALLFLVGGTGSGAQAAPWCAFYDPSTYNCGFHSFSSAWPPSAAPADGGRQNFFEPSGGARQPTGRKTPEARY
jgi:hypothetical protein